jgi:glucans biosynthesis protein
MLIPAPVQPTLSRRRLVALLPAALLGSTALPHILRAQTAAPDTAAPQSFSFDLLSDVMREKAAQDPAAPEPVPDFLSSLTYDDYQKIVFWPDRARWNFKGSAYRIHAFHMGWLFKEAVHVFEVVDGMATAMTFSTEDFEYRGDLKARVPAGFALPGVSGIRLNSPLNRPDLFDEVVSFAGASYFRALGRDNFYGLSARGLAVNTGLSSAEEFPRFSAFYVQRPAPGARTVTVYAALESTSVTGAYRFVITPGEETVIDVTARLYFRAAVEQLGVAPLTSMFLFSEVNRGGFDDYRPQVHDSNGLRIERSDGDVLWRALNNPQSLGSSFIALTRPRSFGLYQRDRDFQAYQDAEAHYELRPTCVVEPQGDWGEGAVRLVEIPSDLEVNDNIVAFWVPRQPVKAGDLREFAYRMRWGMMPEDTDGDLAVIHETRAGHGGNAGVAEKPDTRKFVVDFRGGLLGRLPADTGEVAPVVAITGGTAVVTTLSKVRGSNIWRLVLDVASEPGAVVELSAHVAGFGRKLSEIWLFQWVRP